MTSYSIHILPDTTDTYSKTVLDLMKKHEYSSIILTLGTSPPFLQAHVPNALFMNVKYTPLNPIVEEIKRRKPALVVIENCFSEDHERLDKSDIDPLLNRVLSCSIQQQDIQIVQTIPVSMVNPHVQRFGMAERIYCSKRHLDEIVSLEYHHKVHVEYNHLVQVVPTNKPVDQLQVVPTTNKPVIKQEFRLYQGIHTIHNRTELFLFLQHLDEIYQTKPHEYLVYLLNETRMFLDSHPDVRQSIPEEAKNEYIHNISASISHIVQKNRALFQEILAFFHS